MIEPLLTQDWIKKFEQAPNVFVGLSGGLDSTVLLHALAETPSLKSKLKAIHINHQISPNAKAWEDHCQNFTKSLGVAYQSISITLPSHANLEDEARKARYGCFATLMNDGDILVLAHHADDQAETCLLQLLRGSGVLGLAGMLPIKSFARGMIARPLLNYTRHQLERYCQKYQLKPIWDESNLNTHFSRNFIRHEILPKIKTKWPKAIETIARSTRLCADAQTLMEEVAIHDAPDLHHHALDVATLSTLNDPHLHNLIREWVRLHHYGCPQQKVIAKVRTVLLHAKQDATPELAWGNVALRRFEGKIYLCPKIQSHPKGPYIWSDFPQDLKIEGLGTLVAQKSNQGAMIKMDEPLEIRFRQGGEKIRLHGQTQRLKKHMQALHIPTWERDSVPLIYQGGALCSVVGYLNADPKGSGVQYEFSLILQKAINRATQQPSD